MMTKNFTNLLSRFEEHLKTKRFFSPGSRILVACSGGPDSIALFYLLHTLAPKYGWRLGLLHYDHQLRANGKKDARFVRDLARKFKTHFFLGSGNVKKEAGRTKTSLEECARKMRYGFFTKAARRFKTSRIAFAHTLDDQAETVLMRVLQGTGLRGLQGIRERNRMGRIVCVRPFLAFTKNEILGFLESKKIRYRKDESNDSLRFVRNRIRSKLLPMLRRDFNPRVVESIARIPSIVREESALFEALEKDAWQKAVRISGRGKLEIRHGVFMGLPGPVQFRVLEKALRRIDPQSGISYEAWGRVRAGMSRPRNRWSLPRDIDLSLTPKKIMVYKKNRDNHV